MPHYSGLSLYYQEQILEALPTLYMALDTTEGDANDANYVEVTTSGTGYVRREVELTSYSGGSVTNNADILFPVATASYGTVVALRLMDSITVGAGNCIARCPCDSTAIAENDRFEVLASGLDINLARTIT